MDIESEIIARVDAAKAWDPHTSLSDFQLKATEAGFILKSLRTGQPQFIFDATWFDDLKEDLQS